MTKKARKITALQYNKNRKQIMILLHSHSSSVKSVASNECSPGGCREGEIPMDVNAAHLRFITAHIVQAKLHILRERRRCFVENMNESKWQIFTDAKDLDANHVFTLELQKAMLHALLENKKLTFKQYEQALELLEKKKIKRERFDAKSNPK